jgi:hypothetical protein
MYSTEDFTELDKSKFKCFKFPNGNIYYGETATINEKNELVTEKDREKTQTQEGGTTQGEEEPVHTYKEVRHGNGVQLYEVDDLKCKCKYEGTWYMDKKHGRGVAHFPDGSSYEGDFKDDKFDGVGKFIWKNGHVYIGSWKEGKMNGIGEFKHRDGHILQGQYINNYMNDKELNIFINPFLSMEDLEVFYKDNKLNNEMMLKQKYQFNKNNIKFIYNFDDLNANITQCIKDNYTPLIIRTIEKQINKNDLYNYLNEPKVEIDLKNYYLQLRQCDPNTPKIKKVYDEIKAKFTEAFSEGKILILNFDDCTEGNYDKLFNPSIKELYGNYMFTPKMWRPQNFKEGEHFLEHVHRNENIKLNGNFKFIVYSRFLIEDINANEEQLVDVIKKYFEKDFPLKFMKIFILAEEKKVKEEPKPTEEVVEEEIKDDKNKKNTATKSGKKK